MSKRKKKDRSFTDGGERVSKQKVEKAPEVAPNKFQNDGSFMDMFKKMAEQSQQQQQQQQQQQSYLGQSSTTETYSSPSTTEKETSVRDESLPETTFVAPQAILYKAGPGDDSKRPQQGLIGKRKALLKTAELREKRKKRREEQEEQLSAELADQKGSAWKSYMAEVKSYEARNCGDSDEHKRPLVK